ncbi:MAG: NAD-dependent epimerase/dehydratase family protein [Candidatus Nealsonbacteria bacterium]|nr:NAD-dependent epimerase/dehydratase family protein [Candidatus Nealsonbacteria bacterium]
MAKIIVTGGAGFIGSHLVDKLVEEGHQVVVIDNLSTGKKENLNSEAGFFHLDLRDFEKIKPVFEGKDYVFHLAALPRVPRSVEDPVTTSEINIMGTVNTFEAARQGGVKRVVFASSSSVYGDQEIFPLTEETEPEPISPYALQKLVGEKFATLFSSLYEFPIISLRYFSIFGPRITFESEYSLVIGKFLKLKKEGKPLTIYGDGEQTRAFCYVDDVVRANIKAMESEKLEGGEIINISGEESYTINKVAEIIGGEKEYLPPRKGDILRNQADISLARRLLDWEPQIPFEEGVKKVKEWFNSL